MKRAFLTLGILIVFLSISVWCSAAPRAVWDASAGATGYNLYYTDGTTEYHASTTVTEMPLSELDLVPGVKYTFTATAFNTAGESGRSNSVTWTMAAYGPPADRKPIKITIPSGVTVMITAE